MQKPTIERINKFLSKVCKILNDEAISYFVYGSYAFVHYSNSKDFLINDIDIIINQKSFKQIQELFSKFNLPYKLYVSKNSIHANHKEEIGNDGKPFDLSFDSYEHYLSKYNIDINKFFNKQITDNVEIHIIEKNDLIKIYEIGANDFPSLKKDLYEKKLNELKK